MLASRSFALPIPLRKARILDLDRKPGKVAGVSPFEILRALEQLAGRVGIRVRAESFDLRVIEGRGGLCWLNGVPTVVMDAGLPLLDRIGVLAEALARFDLETIYVPPFLRARIRTNLRKGQSFAARQ